MKTTTHKFTATNFTHRQNQARKLAPAPLLSLTTEVTVIIIAAAAVLFVAVVALLHTLTLFADSIGRGFTTIILPGSALIFAALVPLLKNPIHALLCLLGLFATTALIYLSRGAEYLALVFLIVYVGALAILFLFVIMLLNVKDIMSSQRGVPLARNFRLIFSVGGGLLFAAHAGRAVRLGFETLYQLTPRNPYTTATDEVIQAVTADILGLRALYTTHWPLMVVITIILLNAMLGAIVLATSSVESGSDNEATQAGAQSQLAPVTKANGAAGSDDQVSFSSFPPLREYFNLGLAQLRVTTSIIINFVCANWLALLYFGLLSLPCLFFFLSADPAVYNKFIFIAGEDLLIRKD